MSGGGFVVEWILFPGSSLHSEGDLVEEALSLFAISGSGFK